jgi:hypothetical protein
MVATIGIILFRARAHNQELLVRILLRDVRLAFPSLWKASAPKGGGEAAFSASFLIPKTHKQLAEFKAALKAVAKEKWGAKADAIYKSLEAADKLCLHDGDSKAEYDGFESNLYVSSRSKTRPSVFDGQRQELLEADGKPYSGCFVNASVELWAQDNSFGKRINAQLRGVQFLRDGDAFAGGGTAADADEFDEIAAPDEDAADPLTA